MAELAVTAALILVELVSPFLEEIDFKKNVQKEVNRMKGWLRQMKTFIEDNDGRELGTRRLEDRVEQVRDMAYEIEDILDEILFHSTYVFHEHKITRKGHRLTHNIRHGFPSRGIFEKIENIKGKIEDMKLQNEAFSGGRSSPRSASSSGIRIGQRVSPLLLDDEMVGYKKSKEKFMSQLMDGGKSLVTLAVVGPCGSGKTTFVKNVFWKSRIRGGFDCHAWVLVSKKFDVKELFINMLKQFCKWESCHTLDEALDKLRKYLARKRYIVVLDDIWEKKDWDCIKDALPKGVLGSRIIVTTRASNISSLCATSLEFVHNLSGLEWLEAWSLFCKNAFQDSNGECPVELKSCSTEIVTQCEGLPFAIVAVGSALAQKPKLPIEWKRFHKSLGCEIRRDSYLSVICNSLLPGYMDLSSNLKCCFLYFSLFPEDYSVERGRLIRLWVAERFVLGTDTKTAEEVAEDYLNELIHRNLVHVSNWDFDGRPRSCRVLNLVLVFIVQKCKEENFATIFPRENTSTGQKIWRLSVHGDCSHLSQSCDFAAVRSMFLFRCGIISPTDIGNNFRDFQLLKVLDLQGVPLAEFPQQVTKLILLKYLSLSGTNIKTIPNSITKLHYLETLDLKQTDVTELPKAIFELHNLRHLFAYKYNAKNFVAFDSVQGVKIFEGIRNLTNLQKLSLVKVGQKVGIIKELEKVANLRKLGLMGIKKDQSKDLCTSLEKLRRLTTLDLCSNTKEEYLELGELHNAPPSIQRLYLKGRLEAFPGWISSLDSLQRIGLKWSKSDHCPLKSLQFLPNLIEIQLVDSYVGSELVFEASTFKKLKILVIEEFSSLHTVIIQQDAMPELEKMYLRKCPKMVMLPWGINNLAKIQELILHGMAQEFIARLRKNNSEDSVMVEHIPLIHSFVLNNDQSWSFENLSHSFNHPSAAQTSC